ncbi:MAG: N-acetyltransferase [Chitinophagaceae bacterium]|nr:MAG: N-acetyltransferase [Chitinophagaceae bacterium]
MNLRLRELTSDDIPHIVRYWTRSSAEHLLAMGVDAAKVPHPDALAQNLERQCALPYEQKMAYCIIAEWKGMPVGHCNTNPTSFGEEAYMHLHLWSSAERGKGIGAAMVAGALPYFFNNLKLQRLWSLPYALNEAPSRTLQKAGFVFDKEYVTVPGSLNFEQPVKRWLMTRERFAQLYGTPSNRS